MKALIINAEVKTSLLKRAKSKSDFGKKNLETMWEKTRVEVEETEKLIQVNEVYFNKFESANLHALTYTKYVCYITKNCS